MAWVLWLACYAASLPLQRADTLGRGQVEVAAEGIAFAVLDEEPGAAVGAQLAARVGVLERVDVGARVGALSPFRDNMFAELQTKLRVERRDSPVVVALAPSLEFRQFVYEDGEVMVGDETIDFDGGRIRSVGVRFPVLVGVPVGAHQVVLGPGVDAFVTDAPGPIDVLAPRLSVGFAGRVGAFRLHPEVGLTYPFAPGNPEPGRLQYVFGLAAGVRSRRAP